MKYKRILLTSILVLSITLISGHVFAQTDSALTGKEKDNP